MAYEVSDQEMLELAEAMDYNYNDDSITDQEMLDVAEGDMQVGGALPQQEQGGAFYFNINPYVERTSPSMGVNERQYEVRTEQRGRFNHRQHLSTSLAVGLHGALVGLIDQQHIPDNDRVYINLSSRRLSYAFNYRGLAAGEWRQGGPRVDELLSQMSRALNSNENFEIDDSFQLSFTHVRRNIQGSGQKRKLRAGHANIEKLKKKKTSVVSIRNKDTMCCARSIVTAKAKLDNVPNWLSFKRGQKSQTTAAIQLQRETDIAFDTSCGEEELKKFAKVPSLINYQILVVDTTRQHRVYTYGDYKENKQICLLYTEDKEGNGHYDTITSLTGYFGTSYVCKRCYKPYDNEGRHRCDKNKERCPACQQNVCNDYLDAIKQHRTSHLSCRDCHGSFFGNTCIKQHKEHTQSGSLVSANKRQPSVCQHRKKCKECLKMLVGIKQQEQHKCGYVECHSCKEYVEAATHKCYIQVAPKKENEEEDDDDEQKQTLLVFFDIEAMQDTGKHIPNLVVASTHESNDLIHFKGDNCVHDFLEWLDQLTEDDTRSVTVIAHNFQGYDGYHVVHEYHRQGRIVGQVRNGAKLLQVTMDTIKFIDSLSFFQMPLSAFPKTFGLTELKKGFFPHLFNVPANQTYRGSIPDKSFFMPESMSIAKRSEFDQWYSQQSGVDYNFQKELLEYCESDVQLLKQGCMKFKEVFEPRTFFDPFEHMTIASACNRDLRQNRMAPNTIANEPLHGWRNNINQSIAALEWLHWKADTTSREILHARNDGEYHIPGTRYHADGYHDASRTVYEFHGCFWHGCNRCYKNRFESHQRLEGRTFDDVYKYTQNKMECLRQKGYVVVEMWECEWQRLKANNPDIKKRVDDYHFVEPLNPRDAFCGGRTNAIQLYRMIKPGEKIRYYDFTSLYPWVNKNCEYPEGHPTIISQPNTTDISNYFGIVKCDILPPKGLYHPVLPLRQGGKLTFPLCKTCVQNELEKPFLERSAICTHSDDQRILQGTWCTPELQKAVEMGYVIKHVYEIWHFEKTQHGLFRDYVNTWLKLKEEASGWPSHVGNDETLQTQHLHDYEMHEGICLERDNVQKNPGLRTLAKMMLNSMWGKFGQRTDKTQVKEFDDVHELHNFLDSEKHEVSHVGVAESDDRVEIHYKVSNEDEISSPNLNIFIACFTTCWARLKLYNALQLLGERVLYFDTDSVVFVSQTNSIDPPLGDYLGDFKDELPPDDYIVEFVSGGPKNYAYKTFKGKRECKVRGFTLDSTGSRYVNFDVLKKNVIDDILAPQDETTCVEVPIPFKIQRKANDYTLETIQMYKKYKLVYSKRVVDCNTFKSYPYGYI